MEKKEIDEINRKEEKAKDARYQMSKMLKDKNPGLKYILEVVEQMKNSSLPTMKTSKDLHDIGDAQGHYRFGEELIQVFKNIEMEFDKDC